MHAPQSVEDEGGGRLWGCWGREACSSGWQTPSTQGALGPCFRRTAAAVTAFNFCCWSGGPAPAGSKAWTCAAPEAALCLCGTGAMAFHQAKTKCLHCPLAASPQTCQLASAGQSKRTEGLSPAQCMHALQQPCCFPKFRHAVQVQGDACCGLHQPPGSFGQHFWGPAAESGAPVGEQ